MSNATITVQLVAIECGQCGTVFGLSETVYEKRREDHETFYCPNGHARCFTSKSKAEKLHDELIKARQESEAKARELTQQIQRSQQLERQLSAAKGAATKAKKRAANGVCPCCTRSFQNLRRHMESKHPDHAKEPTNGD